MNVSWLGRWGGIGELQGGKWEEVKCDERTIGAGVVKRNAE